MRKMQFFFVFLWKYAWKSFRIWSYENKIFFWIFLEKTRCFNIEFIFYSVNIQPDIMQNWLKNTRENKKNWKDFLISHFFLIFLNNNIIIYIIINKYILNIYGLGWAHESWVGSISAQQIFFSFLRSGWTRPMEMVLDHPHNYWRKPAVQDMN
jgi:hypothetical protein